MFRCIRLMAGTLATLSLLGWSVWGQTINTNNTINPIPSSADSTFLGKLQTFLLKENADRTARMSKPFVYAGGTAPTSASLSHTIAAVQAFVHGYAVSQDATLVTYAGTRRSYLYLDSLTSRSPEITVSGGTGCTFAQRYTRIIRVECAAASGEPTLGVPGLLQLFSADTSGSAVTAVNRMAFKDPQGAMERTINVLSHGAIPNDGLDDYAAFADAVALAKEMGQGRIIIPPGEYILSSPLVITGGNDIIMEGLGSDPSATGTVRFIGLTASQPVIRLLTSNRITVKNIFLNHGVTASTDIHAIEVTDCNGVVLEELAIWPDFNATPTTGSYAGILLNTSATATFDTRIIRTKILNTRGNGITLVGQDNTRRISETWIEEVQMFTVAGAGGDYAGIHIGEHVTGVYVKNRTSIAGSHNYALHVQKSAVGPAPLDLFLDNVVFDAPQQTNVLITNASGVHISNSWISAPQVAGWAIDNASAASVGMEVWNSIIGALFSGGIRYGGAHALISGNHMNGFLAASTGIHLTSTSQENYIDGNRIMFFTTPVLNQGLVNSFGLNQYGSDPRPISSSGIAIGDTLFTLGVVTGNPFIGFNPNTSLVFNRTPNSFAFTIESIPVAVFDKDGTAGGTRFWLFDISDSTLKRVFVGADNSGGTGYKILRVEN